MLKQKSSTPKTEEASKTAVTAPPEIHKMVSDSQRLLIYMARNGSTELDPDIANKLVDAKYKLENGEWEPSVENTFLTHYDKLAKAVYPVTVDSINAVIPSRIGNNKHKTKAEKAVIWYRRYTMLALVMLILLQAFWLIGNELRSNLQNIFDQREQTRSSLQQAAEGDEDWGKLTEQLKIDDQRLDANYNLLLIWNQVWSLGNRFSVKLPPYFKAKYELSKQRLESNLPDDQHQLDNLELEKSLHEVRIVFFENILSADFALLTFQSYILPLLYGLLGAFIYVLRELLKEIKELTFNFDSEIRYRLRLTLGALGGMVIGFFLKDDEAGNLASLSPMAIAFLMGYNVEVLFSIMDKMIDNIKSALNKPQTNPAPPAPVAASVAASPSSPPSVPPSPKSDA